MNIIKVILQICGLYIFYMIGTWIQHISHLPIPGMIIGMLLLFLCLLTGIIKSQWLESGADFLITILPLLFLPSVIGVMKYGSFFIHKGLILVLLVVVNTILVMILGSLISQTLAKRATKKAGDPKK